MTAIPPPTRHFPRLFSNPALELEPVSDNMQEANDFRVRLRAPDVGGELVEVLIDLHALTDGVNRMRDLFVADGLIAGVFKIDYPKDAAPSHQYDRAGAERLLDRQRLAKDQT